MINKAVWVADDERSIRWVLEKALTQEGFAVTCFDTAESLLSMVDSRTRGFTLMFFARLA